MEYIVSASNISKKYRKFYALKNMNMSIKEGCIYGLVGRNGSGKTTLIRVLCGLQEETEGDYSLFGVKNSSKEIVKSRRRIGAVVETPSIYLGMTAYENLKSQCDNIGLPDCDNISTILKQVGLSDTGKKKARNFSLGMKQRLGIAIALVGSPDFLILDEPLNGLDPQGMVEIRELILKLNEQLNITFLISSHMLSELSKVATHYGFMDKGTIIKEISAEQLNESCRKCVRIEVSDISVLIKLLDDMKLEYKVVAENIAHIYGDMKLNNLVVDLSKLNCDLLNVTNEDETLESYYINLIGDNKKN